MEKIKKYYDGIVDKKSKHHHHKENEENENIHEEAKKVKIIKINLNFSLIFLNFLHRVQILEIT